MKKSSSRRHRRRSKKKFVDKHNIIPCNTDNFLTSANIKVNKEFPSKLFKIACIHSSNNPKSTDIYLIGGYVTGAIDIDDMEDTFWMAEAITKFDLTKTNIYVVNWDNRTLSRLRRDFWRIYHSGFDVKKFKKTFMETLYFPSTYVSTIVTGNKLAKLLINYYQHKHKKVILMGHSLGGKIILECLSNLYQSGYHINGPHKPVVTKAILLGTADYQSEQWENASKATIYQSINVYNPKDKVLFIGLGIISKLFGTQFFSNPFKILGRTPSRHKRFSNLNCSTHMRKPIHLRCEGLDVENNPGCFENTLFGHNYSTVIDWVLKHPTVKKNGIPLIK